MHGVRILYVTKNVRPKLVHCWETDFVKGVCNFLGFVLKIIDIGIGTVRFYK